MKLKPAFISKDSMVKKDRVTKKSFNEDVEIEFEESTHRYFHNGKQLTGATDYIKKFYKPFDADMIAQASAKSWGVDKNDVRSLWDSNRDLTSGFGTIVHKALDHYNKFKSTGDMISFMRGDENNYCLPKHPILRSIVTGFIEQCTASPEAITYSEVLLSNVEKGICGQADLILVLDPEKKICRVQDYKININSEELSSSHKPLPPFSSLPANKLTKYQLQMSIYANLLELSGWVVEGLDVFVYEDNWKFYSLPVIKVI